jgi:hypothetical protein
MPITPYLDGFEGDSEAKRILGVAFEMACVALQLAGRSGDLADEVIARRMDEVIARRMIELARAGERNPDVLCETILKDFDERRF